MKNKLLLITKNPGNYLPIIESKYKNNNIIWLQLWPVVATQEIEKRFPALKIIKSTDFISNDDHFNIAKEVTEISKNWWNLLGLSKYGKEWEIDGLKITQIFAYEIEQVLTNLMFQILTVKRAINKVNPDELLFVDFKKTLQSAPKQMFEEFVSVSLFPFFQKNNMGVIAKQIFINQINKRKIHNYALIIEKIFSMNHDILIRKIKQKIIRKRILSNAIIISNSNRCLQKFEEVGKNFSNIFVLNDAKYINLNYKQQLKKINDEIAFDGISLHPFFIKIIPIIENNFNNLKHYYKKNIELAKAYNPKTYITVNLANSTELVKLWAFKNYGVRTVLASEGLGQPDNQLDIVVNSVLHPEIDIERWVSSKNFAKKYINNKKKVIISGYLNYQINEKLKAIKNTKSIVFALSIVSPYVKRAIVGEDMFEMLKSLSDVADAVSAFTEYKLILKLHPGDAINIPLYKEAIGHKPQVRIVINGKLNKIINESALVIIYDTSVGLESLLRGKNVICYNYTNRPTYITSIYDYVNHNPAKGAALLMTHSKQELKDSIEKLLPYGENNRPSPGLEYVLENARKDYDPEKVVKDLITCE